MYMGIMEIIIVLGVVGFVAIAALLIVVAVAVTTRRSYAGPSNPDAAPCPKCGALVSLSKSDCPACGARVA